MRSGGAALAVMAPQMTPPPESVVSAFEPEQLGRAKLSPPAVILRPPASVEVPVSWPRRTPEVSVTPFDVSRPPKTEPPEKDEVALSVLTILPPVMVSPSDEASPPVATERPFERVEVPEPVSVKVEAPRIVPSTLKLPATDEEAELTKPLLK